MEWKVIERYDGLYEVSNTGLIKSNHGRGRLLKLHKTKKGYLRTSLSKSGMMETVIVHREVAKAFIPNPENKPQVNHIDNDKSNNHVSNLEWVTNQENMDHANINGFRDGIYVNGEDHGQSRLTKKEVIGIKSKYMTGDYSIKEISDMYDVSATNINHILTERTWSHVNVDGFNPRSPKERLTEKEVIEIKRLLNSGKYLQKEIAEMYGVVRTNISRINTGVRWGHVEI